MMGYPSIDKPWLKYYSEQAINDSLPQKTMYEYAWENNCEGLTDVAIRYFGTKITYGQFFDHVKRAAKAFTALGVKAGDIVTIMSMHTPETIYALYGLNYLGAVANMVYMTLSKKEILNTLENTKSKLFFVLDPALEQVERIRNQIKIPVIALSVADSMPMHYRAGYILKNTNVRKTLRNGQYLSWSEFLKKGDGIGEIEGAIDHAAMAIIIYTSGTTGEPKGVCLSNDNLNAIVEGLKKTDRNYHRGDSTLLFLPPFIGFGISMLHLCIATGMDSDCFIIVDAKAVGKRFAKIKPNRLVAGAPFLDGLMKYGGKDFSKLIDITGGGVEIELSKEHEFNDFLAKVGSKTKYLMGYGMTEFGSVISLSMMDAYREESVGVPLCHNIVRIEDPDTRKELAYGEIGEICVSTPSLMMGYYCNKNATDRSIQIDEQGFRWMRTGDLGCIDQDGFLYIKGRIKRIYMTKGDDGVIYRIFPQRIEELFLTSDKVYLCGVIVKKDNSKLGIAVAFVELREGMNNVAGIKEELMDMAKRDLPEHMHPAEIRIIEHMPMTASGKIDYRKLEEKR